MNTRWYARVRQSMIYPRRAADACLVSMGVCGVWIRDADTPNGDPAWLYSPWDGYAALWPYPDMPVVDGLVNYKEEWVWT